MERSQPRLVATNISYAGLGNRMRFTLSALSLAHATGREFLYAWPQTDDFRPPLTRLWDFGEQEISVQDASAIARDFDYVRRVEDLPDGADSLGAWCFRSGDALTLPEGALTWAERLRELTPAEDIRDKVLGIHAEHFADAPYVGVSIRAHERSHSRTLEHSPVDWYLGRMSEMRAVNPDVKFFISCDVPAIQERIIREFPGSYGQDDKGGYNSTEGVVASVVDLYLLAASNYMLVPYWSSFPSMAWELSGQSIAKENSQAGRLNVDPLTVPRAVNPLTPSLRGEGSLPLSHQPSALA